MKALEQQRTTKRLGYWQDGAEDPRWWWRLDTGGVMAVTLAGLRSQTWLAATQRCWQKLWTYVGTRQALQINGQRPVRDREMLFYRPGATSQPDKTLTQTTRHDGNAQHEYMVAGHRIKILLWAALPFGCTSRFQGWCENIAQEQQHEAIIAMNMQWRPQNIRTPQKVLRSLRSDGETMLYMILKL